MNEMGTDAFLEKLKRSVMADPDHALKAKIRTGETVSGHTGKVHGVTKTITLTPDDSPGEGGLRTIENGITYGAGLLTMGCYAVTTFMAI